MKNTILAFLLAGALAPAAFGFNPEELWRAWPEERFVKTPAPCLRPAELAESLRALAKRHPERLRLEEAGRSFEGRPIHLLTLGRGPRKVLLWSQMHGDEPSATPALLDVADFLLSRGEDGDVESILDGVTLLMVPMLNPDGAELYARRNAQSIDVNRDALNLATPEGRLLKRLRDEHEPFLGFNLHDQNRRTAAGDTGRLATIAVLAVAGDPQGTVTPGRRRAKRACTAIVETLAPFNPGGTARYDEDWSPRAFGDNLTAWGTPVVLIESGGLPPGHGFAELSRLNFVALLTVLRELVRDDLAGYDPEVYDQLPRNTSDAWVDVVVRGGSILRPGSPAAYRADLAFNLPLDERAAAGCPTSASGPSRVVEIGDGRFLAAGHEVDAGRRLLVPPFVAGIRGYSARRWLDADTLVDLARLGVGTVHWRVAARRLAKARETARELNGGGRARIDVVAHPSPEPWLVLTGPPSTPASPSLADVVAALAGKRRPVEVESPGHLWPSGPGLRKDRPASFLLVTPGAWDNLRTTRLDAVWIDGVEVEPKP